MAIESTPTVQANRKYLLCNTAITLTSLWCDKLFFPMQVWSMPLQILLALYFLYHELGVAMLAGVVILVLLIPFNIVTGKYNTK